MTLKKAFLSPFEFLSESERREDHLSEECVFLSPSQRSQTEKVVRQRDWIPGRPKAVHLRQVCKQSESPDEEFTG